MTAETPKHPNLKPPRRTLRSRWLWGCIVVVLMLFGVQMIRRAMQPQYQGKTAEEWFAEIDPYDRSPQASEDLLLSGDNPAIQAFRHFGPEAARFLWRECHHRDSPAKAWLIRKVRLWSRNKWIIESEAGRNFKAAMALEIMGPKADCLIPEVIDLAQSPNEGKALQGLELLGHIGTRTEVTVPLLISNLDSPTNAIAMRSLRSLLRIGRHASNALPAVERQMERRTGDDRLLAATAMAALGDQSRLNLLLTELQDTSSPLRKSALFMVDSLKSDGTPAVPVLLEIIQDSNQPADVRKLAAQVLERMPPEARRSAKTRP